MKLTIIALYASLLYDLYAAEIIHSPLTVVGFSAGFALAAFLIHIGLSAVIPADRRKRQSYVAHLGGFK
jgi:hypothetical protein